jgi:hypothetical protein
MNLRSTVGESHKTREDVRKGRPKMDLQIERLQTDMTLRGVNFRVLEPTPVQETNAIRDKESFGAGGVPNERLLELSVLRRVLQFKDPSAGEYRDVTPVEFRKLPDGVINRLALELEALRAQANPEDSMGQYAAVVLALDSSLNKDNPKKLSDQARKELVAIAGGVNPLAGQDQQDENDLGESGTKSSED